MRDAPTPDTPVALARSRVNALRATLETREGHPVRLIETHISWVLLTPTLAYKLKKPVQLPFLDFGTLAARRHFCEEELRLNRRLAPSVYLDVVELRAGPAGPDFGSVGPVLDTAVRMQRFPDGALWSERVAAGTLLPRDVDAMARRLCDFHAAAPVAPDASGYGSASVHARVTRRLVDAIDAWHARAATRAGTNEWLQLRAWLDDQLRVLAPLWEQRLRHGRVREGHGDLHLANVLQLDDEPTAFDGIEFDAELRWIDVLDDMAFLAMDLLAHGQRALAFRFVDAYLENGGDHDGLPALRYHLVCRALVRAQVHAIAEGQGQAAAAGPGTADYLRLACALALRADPRLAITHGLPGSGKSFLSQGLLEAAGAIRLRSDVERKRLFGLGARESSHDRVVGGIYDAAATARTYARLLELARLALSAGWPVVVDAAFLRRHERGRFAALAAGLALPYSILDCRASMPLLRQRLLQRQAAGGDASEAGVTVLELLSGADEPLDELERAVAIVAEAAQPVAAEELATRWQRATAAP